MGNFGRDNRSGGRRDYGQRNFRRRSFGGARDRQMYKTTCSNCGKDCEIPFVPTGDRPVFCSECFEKMGGSSSSRRFRDMGDRQPRNDVQLEAISTKLDKILKILTPVSPPQIVVAKKKTS